MWVDICRYHRVISYQVPHNRGGICFDTISCTITHGRYLFRWKVDDRGNYILLSLINGVVRERNFKKTSQRVYTFFANFFTHLPLNFIFLHGILSLNILLPRLVCHVSLITLHTNLNSHQIKNMALVSLNFTQDFLYLSFFSVWIQINK